MPASSSETYRSPAILADSTGSDGKSLTVTLRLRVCSAIAAPKRARRSPNSLRRECIPLHDQFPNAPAALGRVAGCLALHCFRSGSKLIILDVFFEPFRVFAALEMVKPGLLVDAFHQVQECDQVRRPEVQPVVGSAEEETPVGR